MGQIRETICKVVCGDILQQKDQEKEAQAIELTKAYNRSADIRQAIIDKLNQQLTDNAKQASQQLQNCQGLLSIKQLKPLSPIDVYCQTKLIQEVKKVYKDKIIINNVLMPCNLIEMCTPNGAVVSKVRDSITPATDRMYWYQKVMNKVHSLVTWTDDGRYDNYFYPCYTLTTGKGDCDDGTFAQMSIEPEMGNAFGFFIDDKGNRLGHSFAVGIIENELWIFDWTGNIVKKYLPNQQYYIHYIVSKNKTYQLDGSIEFGDILWGAKAKKDTSIMKTAVMLPVPPFKTQVKISKLRK